MKNVDNMFKLMVLNALCILIGKSFRINISEQKAMKCIGRMDELIGSMIESENNTPNT